MATKHIPDPLWQLIESKTLEIINSTQVVMKAEDMLKLLIQKGLEELSEDDVRRLKRKKKSRIGDKSTGVTDTRT